MCSKKRYAFEPDYAVVPGDTVREIMECRGMTQKDFANRLDTTPQTLNRIFNGDQAITPDMANKLEKVTGTSAAFWSNLETLYRTQLVKIDEANRFAQEKDWLKNFPIKVLQQRGYIKKGLEFTSLFDAVLSFFGVSNSDAWAKIWQSPAAASRRSPCFECTPYYAATWIRMGEIAAQKMACGETNINAFKKILPEIKQLTKEEPITFIPKLEALCSSCGVAFVLIPEFHGLTWSGATKWLGSTAIIMLNLRGKAEDKFWFSFFHEASHVINDSKLELLINDGSHNDPREARANEFARKFLFGNMIDRIQKAKSALEIASIANALDISPGIVAGQHQFVTGRYHFFRDIIRRFEWQ